MPSMDPYFEWMGISAEEQPPDHYRLLALPVFEENPKAIQAAARRSLQRIEAHRPDHAPLCDRLKKEIQAAQKCLLDPDRKADYDRTLQARMMSRLRAAKPGNKPRLAAKRKKPSDEPKDVKKQQGRSKDPAPVGPSDDPPSDMIDDVLFVPLEGVDRPTNQPPSRKAKRGTEDSDPNLYDDTMPVFKELEDFNPLAESDDVSSLLDSLFAGASEGTLSDDAEAISGGLLSAGPWKESDNGASDPLLALLPVSSGYDLLPLEDEPKTSVTAQLSTPDANALPTPQPAAKSGGRHKIAAAGSNDERHTTSTAAAETPAPNGEAGKSALPTRRVWIKAALLGGGIAVALGLLGASFLWRASLRTSETSIAANPRPRPRPQEPSDATPHPPESAAKSPESEKRQPARPSALPEAKPVHEADMPMLVQDQEQAVSVGDAWWMLGQQRRGRERDYLLLRACYWYTQSQSNRSNDVAKSNRSDRLAIAGAIADPRADVDGGPWGAALQWPVVLKESLYDRAAIGKFNCFPGLGSSEIRADDGQGLRVAGGQSATTLWLKSPLAACYELSLRFTLSNQGTLALWSAGPGQGNSTQLGYCLLVGDTRVDMLRKGALVSSVRIRPHLERGVEHQATVLRDGNRFLVWVDQTLMLCYEDPFPLGPPLHGRLGVGAVGGQPETGVRLANLVLRHPSLSETDRRLAVVRLSPYPTAPPSPNREILFESPAGDTVGEGWFHSQPDFSLPVSRDKLLLSGPNGTPLVLRRTPIEGDFAFEVTFLYQEPRLPRATWTNDRSHQDNYLQFGGEALNLHLLAYFEPQFPASAKFESFTPDVAAGWEVGLPDGDGNNTITWASGQQRRVVAQMPYYAPIPGQEYVARLERRGDRIRVFLNGSLLLEARQRVAHNPSPVPAFVGFRQIFGGSIVRRAAAWRIDRDSSTAISPR